jgi:hypothetical protein
MIPIIVRMVIAMAPKPLIFGLINLLGVRQRELLVEELYRIRNGSNRKLIIFIDDILSNV